jgi:hypothetical protein
MPSDRLIHWRLWHRDSGDWIVLKTPFQADYVEALKQEVPSDARKWAPELNAWVVFGAHLSKVSDLLGLSFASTAFCRLCFGEVGRRGPRDIFAGGDPIRCLTWQRFRTEVQAYEEAEDARQREYLRTHPKQDRKKKKPYATPLDFSKQKPDRPEAKPADVRYLRSLDLDET